MPTARDIICCKCGCLKKTSDGIVAWLEKLFYILGGVVARHPWKTISLSMLVCGLMGIGLIKWKEEKRYIKNFLPHDSRILAEHDWITANFPGARVESLIIEDENVLTAQSINAVFDIYETALKLQTADGKNMTEICVSIGPTCQVSSILELWLYNSDVIRNLTDVDVFNTVNQDKIISPVYLNEIHPETFLGQIQRDENGKITGAKATTMFYLLEGNNTMEMSTMDLEQQLITFVNEVGHGHLHNVYIYTARTYEDEAIGTLYKDLKLLFIGFCLVFLYLTLSIGQLSQVHHKVILGSAGLLSIAMSISFTYGLALATGIMFGHIHQVLPFLLLGIGVDDIFVIMETLNNLSPKERELPVDARMALTLKSAGVSVTVTSITDVVAFGIGSTTVIPALSTFCIYATVGVFALYILQTTFFVACLALDEKRKDSRRNACILCYKHRDKYKPNKYYAFSIQRHVMKSVWGPALTKMPVKVVVILLFIGLTSVNIWSFLQIKFDYLPSKYLPSDSYSAKFVKADHEYFPNYGPHVQLFCGEADYATNIDTFLQLYGEIRQQSTVQPSTVDFWLASYQRWLYSTTGHRLMRSYMEGDAIQTSILMEDDFEIDTNVTLDSLSLIAHPSYDSPGEIVNISSSVMPNNSSSNVSDKTVSSTLDELHSPYLSKDVLQTASNASDSISEDFDPDETSPLYNITLVDASLQQNSSDDHSFRFASSVCQFLQTPQGRIYERVVKVDCWSEPTKITGSVLTFNHVKCNSSECDIDAMNGIRAILDGYTFRGGGTCFVYSDPQYMYNETNEALKVELYRNLALAAVSVFIVTLILITNIWTSILVFICVVCTVIDVAGTMQFWDISVDMASSVILILCFGLAVDYSAHVGHSFMTCTGSKNERLRKTISSIGPAVWSGGVSTFLAFSLLYFCTSYGFVLFFRIFTSVVIFGLFHGLVFLPVILSVIGPPPYETQISAPVDSSKQHTDTASAMLPRGNGEVTIELNESPFKDCEDSVFCNGNIWHSLSDIDLEKDSRKSPKSPRYSGSYYEQLSNGSWEEIPYEGKR